MSIAFVFNAFPTNSQGGGAVVKLRKIRDCLVGSGHSVDLYNQWRTNLEHYDVYHHFSMFPADLPMYRFAKGAGLKVCVETMYWGSWRHTLAASAGEGWGLRARRFARYAQRRLAPATTRERAILDLADCVMANSKFEKSNLVRDFGVDPAKIVVCHNGVDRTFADADASIFEERYGLRDFVLMTGLFEERKNQLGLIRAMKGSGIPLVLIGGAPGVHQWYYDACKAEADDSVHFVDYLDHDDPVFRSAYAACRVLAMPSWHETTGKSHLEAGLLARNVLMTTFAPAAREYLGSRVFYADPHDRTQLRREVKRAFDAPEALDLQEHVANNFIWDHVLRTRLEAYRSLL